MQFRHANKILKRIDEDADFDGGFSPGVVKAFRGRMQFIRAATNENDLRAMKSFHFEKLKGDRKGQCSIRLNNQFRLLFEIEKMKGGNRLAILEIADYH
jgi:proteic killer suppression protein